MILFNKLNTYLGRDRTTITSLFIFNKLQCTMKGRDFGQYNDSYAESFDRESFDPTLVGVLSRTLKNANVTDCLGP